MVPARTILLPLSPLFGAGVAVRNWLFDADILKSHSLNVPVISVGNISTGGVGKTPFVELVARRLVERGRKVAIVSRGYGRSSRGTLVVSNGRILCAEPWRAGDEPAQMAVKLSGVVVIVDSNRPRAARMAVESFGAEAIVLDDGFQHRYLSRDVDIVLLRAGQAFERGHLLPAGDRREPLGSLRRAGLLVITQCPDTEEFDRARSALESFTGVPMVGVQIRVSAFRKASTRFSLDLNGLRGKTIVAFSGIGSPPAFEHTLASLGLELKHHAVYRDHYWFSPADLRRIFNEFERAKADYLVTTEKDVARLGALRDVAESFFERNPVYYVEVEHRVIAGEENLEKALAKY